MQQYVGGAHDLNIAAFDIGGTAIKYCLYDNSGTFEKRLVREVPTGAGQGGTVLDKVSRILSAMDGFDAIAVSTAGQVDPVAGTILYATGNLPGYTGTKIRSILENVFHVPVVVENDVNAAALGEAAFGAGKDYPDFLCLTYGTGIGGAIVIDRKIYYGSSFSAAEIGHMITHACGLPCTCGNCGCYEAYASTTALVRIVRERSGLTLNGREIFAELDRNAVVGEAVAEWMDEVIWGLVSLTHIFNPPCIILGGGIMNEPRILNYIEKNIRKHLMKSYWNIAIKQASLGNTAGLQGVISLAQAQFKGRRNSE